MSLYADWQNACEQARTSQNGYQNFWNSYFQLEKEAYKTILSEHESILSGTIRSLSEKLNMTPEYVIGFLDGANESFLSGAKDISTLGTDDIVSLDFDFEKLYYNMHKAKADWLFNLKEWDNILSQDRRRELAKEYRSSLIYVRDVKIGRNDPCPCGSGKKYKNCCGKNA